MMLELLKIIKPMINCHYLEFNFNKLLMVKKQ